MRCHRHRIVALDQRGVYRYRLDHSVVQTERTMRVSVSDAKAQLTELVRRAEAGDEVILTRHGHPAVRLVPIRAAPDSASRRALLDAVRASARVAATAGPDAAASQDFLYGDDGLPG